MKVLYVVCLFLFFINFAGNTGAKFVNKKTVTVIEIRSARRIFVGVTSWSKAAGA